MAQSKLPTSGPAGGLTIGSTSGPAGGRPADGRPADGRPALLVSGSPQGVRPALLRELVAWAGFTLALDSGAEQLTTAGLRPDLLVGDFDSLAKDRLAEFEHLGVAVERHDAYKDATDLELGIKSLLELGYKRLIATNVLGGRNDHALGSLAALAAAASNEGVEVALRDNREACFFIDGSTSEQVLELEFPEFSSNRESALTQPLLSEPLLPQLPLPEHISLIAWGGSSTVSLAGTEWELNQHCLSPESALGISNILRSPRLRLRVHQGSATVLLFLTF